jgi:hypothetical protein
MTLAPDLGMARRFLDLFGEGLMHRFQTFHDKGPEYCSDLNTWHEEGDLDELSTRLARAQSLGAGVYFTVNESVGGRSIENIKTIRALFLDLDGSPLEPVLAMGLEPHAIVCSSPGKYQVYWMVAHCPLERFKPLQLALAKKFSGDPSVKDLPRVMRVPGFYHQKEQPRLVTIRSIEYFLPYPLDTIIDGLEIRDLEIAASEKQSLPPLFDAFESKVSPGGRHAHLMRYASKFAHEGKPAEEVYGLVQAINHLACTPPKPAHEIHKIVEAAMGYKDPPVDLTGLIDANSEQSEYGSASDLALPECFVCGAPGLVGGIADWISVSTSRYQPHFALAAALSFVGVLKGHRVQTDRRSRTNHMTLALGKSGSGKSEAGSKLDDLAKLAGLDNMMMGVPASDSGLRGGLSARTGRVFLYWDEMGLALEGMLSRNAAFHYKAIKDLLIEVWTKSSTMLRKKELITKEAQKAHVDIIQPCLGLFGTAQPDVFYGALSTAHAADGFFPRLLVFETTNNYPGESPIVYQDPPSLLIDKCREIDQTWPTNARPSGGNLDQIIIDPRIVSVSPSARRLFDAAKSDVERNLMRTNESSISGIIARSLEHIEKIALTVEDGPEISRASMEWSIDLVTRLSASMAASFKLRVSDSVIERTKKRVLQVIAAEGNGGIPTNVLTRKTQFLRDRRERDVVLSELESSGLAHTVSDTVGGKTVKRWVVTGSSKVRQS